jgi:glycosyltransferase involved in cell wall biosynthesis
MRPLSRQQPLRILMVTGAYYPEISSGGVQCRNIAQQLRGRADVHVLTTSVDPSLPRHDVVGDVPVTRIRIDVRSEVSKVRAFRRMAIELVRLVRRCDIVHLHGYSTKNVLVTIVAKAFRKPVVMSLHTAGYDEPKVIEEHGSLALWSFMSADYYLSVSQGLVDAYLSAGMPAEKIRLVPNGIDIDRFSPANPAEQRSQRAQLGLPADVPIVLFIGFFSTDKQPRVLFDAWLALLRRGCRTALIFVGATKSAYFEVDDSIAGGMERDAAAAGVSSLLHFAGVTHDVPAYLRAADVFVLPSRREGLPVALLEAMACGLPCIASRLHGSTDAIIEDQVNGVLVPAGDVPAFASAIAELINDPQRRARLGSAARATIVAEYSSASIADRWLDVYHVIPGSAR